MPTKTEPTGWDSGAIYLDIRHQPQGLVDHLLQNSFGPVTGTNFVTTGANHPDWKERLRENKSATTSLEGTRLSAAARSYSNASLSLRRWNQAQKRFEFRTYELYGPLCAPGGISSPPSTDTALLAEAERTARLLYLSRVRAALTSIQGQVALGEMGQTLRMLKGRARQIIDGTYDYLSALTKRAKRRRTPTRRDVKRIVTETWLEYSYGWKPLYSDIYGLVQAYDRLVTSPRDRKKVSAKVRREGVGTTVKTKSKPYPGVSPIFKVTSSYQERFVCDVKFHGSVSLEARPGGFAEQLGLGPAEFIPTIWELIPYSFLVDYFANIGQLLNLAAIQSSRVKWTEYGHRTVASRIFTAPYLESIHPPTGWEVLGKGFSPGTPAATNRVSVKRGGASPSVSLADLRFEIPGLGLKWLNMVALGAASRRTSQQLSAY